MNKIYKLSRKLLCKNLWLMFLYLFSCTDTLAMVLTFDPSGFLGSKSPNINYAQFDLSQKSRIDLNKYLTALNYGSAQEQYELGLSYLQQDRTKQYDQRAFNLFEIAAEKYHEQAHKQLIVCYEKGIGIEKNTEKAQNLFKLTQIIKAVNENNAEAQYKLGCYYEQDTDNVEKNLEKAVKLLQLSANQGFAAAQSKLGWFYLHGIGGVLKNQTEAVRLFQLAASQNDAEGKTNLGICFQEGFYVSIDYEAAFNLYKEAAEQNFSHAQYRLGYCYRYRIGTEENPQLAIESYQLAADQDDADAQYELGDCYTTGYFVLKDAKKAFYAYQLAANNGHATAQYIMGNYLEHGIVVQQDYKLALYCYKLAASQGHLNAQVKLLQFKK